MIRNRIGLLVILLPCLAPFRLAEAQVQAAAAVAGARIDLARGWTIQSSAKVAEKGGAISTRTFPTADWYKASVPTTVVAALVANKAYPEPYFGMNLRSLPGTSYNIGGNFANTAMPAVSRNLRRLSWLILTSFRGSGTTSLPQAAAGRTCCRHGDLRDVRLLW